MSDQVDIDRANNIDSLNPRAAEGRETETETETGIERDSSPAYPKYIPIIFDIANGAK